MKEYTVIYEQGKEGEENWSAYVPDLPGCVTTGDTFEEVQTRLHIYPIYVQEPCETRANTDNA